MLSTVIGLFSQDLAVDLGTSNTRVHLRGVGVVCDEPTVMVVHEHRSLGRRMVAIGEEAVPMLGRTPRDLEAIQPIREGRIDHFEVAEAFLLHLVRRAHGRNGWMRPRMVVAVPHHASDMEVRAVRDSCESAGAREVQLVARPVATALGAGLPIHKAQGTLVIDMGGGSTEVSLLALGGVVLSKVVAGGGEGMDQALVQWLAQSREILVGRPSAERLKIELGLSGAERTATVRGRCMVRGVPRSVEVTGADVTEALAPHVHDIAAAVEGLLAEAPPELSTDVVERGVVLTGGGSQLHNVEAVLRDWTHFPFVHAETPQLAVVHGLGRILEEGTPTESRAAV